MGRAIVRKPKAFLFDEPLSNLDALLRSEMRVEMKKLHQKLGETIVYVTHDQVEAMTLADRIVVLQAGTLIQYDTPDGIYNRPAAKFVAGFTGSPPMNFLPCRVGEGGRSLHLAGAVDLPVPAARVALCAQHAGRTVTFGLRPEHVTAGASADPAMARVDGDVILLEPLGSDTLGLVRVGKGADAGEITGRFPPDAALRVGERMTGIAGAQSISSVRCRLRCRDSRRGVVMRFTSVHPEGEHAHEDLENRCWQRPAFRWRSRHRRNRRRCASSPEASSGRT